MNIWTFDFLYDLTEQYKSFTELILLYPYFIRVSWQQISQYIVWISLNVLTYLFWFTVWVKVNQIYLSISQGSFGYSSVYKVYSEFRVWLLDNNNFPQDSIFDTTLKSKEFRFAKQLHFMILPSKLSGSNCLRLNILLIVHLLGINSIKLLWS